MKNIFQCKFCLALIFLVLSNRLAFGDEQVNKTEVQWVVCESSVEILFAKINIKPDAPKQRDVYYVETPNLDLYTNGAVIRTRVSKEKKKKIKTAAKINYETENQVPWSVLESKEYKCEEDAYLNKVKIGCSLFSYPENLDKVICSNQEKFIEKESGFQQWNKTSLLGPALSSEWSWYDDSLGLSLAVEETQVDKYYYNIEISTRVDIENRQQVADQIQSWLRDRQIKLCPLQKGRTGDLLRTLSVINLQPDA